MSSGKIDWAALHVRLQAAQARLYAESALGSERTRAILQARARALARPPDLSAGTAPIELINFSLAHETYAVESAFVREVYPLKDLTPLPCTPAFVVGIVNLRGEIVSIVDLRRFFNLAARGLTDLNQVIVLQDASMTFGILADQVLGVSACAATDIAPAPPVFSGVGGQYLKGLTGERSGILDAAKLLADPRLVVLETI